MMIFSLNYVHFFTKSKLFCYCIIFTNVFYTKIVALMLNSNEYYYLTRLPMFDVTFVMYVCMCGQMAPVNIFWMKWQKIIVLEKTFGVNLVKDGMQLKKTKTDHITIHWNLFDCRFKRQKNVFTLFVIKNYENYLQ